MPTIGDALKARMSYDIARQGLIAGNIANASTPGYLPADIKFESYLQAAQGSATMTTTDLRHLTGNAVSRSIGQVMHDKSYVQHNGNGVRLDQEMLKQQQTAMDFNYITQLYASRGRLQKIALGRAQ